ncbi:hypothetical protein, partial [Burkholderia ambifaria]|uniref:hypothetical protein n=1 Tax=Burkholderia ambifaria TaxID=152480 RepID=UPI001E61CD96
MGKAVDRMCVGGESANLPPPLRCRVRAWWAARRRLRRSPAGAVQCSSRTSISRGDAEPVYYLKITLRTARFAEHRNETVSRPRRHTTSHVGPRV